MKKIRFNVFASLALATLLASCAGLEKMKKSAPAVTYSVSPEILETHGGKVDITVKVKIPEKYFDKSAVLEATPVLVYDGGETAFSSYTLQGEAVEGNDKAISYLSGGQFTYTGSVDYNDKMRVSDLVVRVKARKGDSELDFEPQKIADGVISTAALVDDNGALAAIGKDNFQRIISQVGGADIYFLIQQANLRGTELKKEEVKALNDFIKAAKSASNMEFKGAEISAYASPDGAVDLNTKLAGNRESVAKSYLSKQLKKAKVDQASGADFFAVKNTPEDWDGFKALVEKSEIQDKELILRVLSMYSDPEVREKEIKNMAETFEVLADEILPKLRRSKLAVNVDVVGKSDEEIAELAGSNPETLNVEELLYAATLTDDAAKQLSIYKSATTVFPEDWRGFNNVGCVLADQGKLDDAIASFEKAKELKDAEPVVMNNLGVIALKKGDYTKAEEFFGAAAGVGAELDNNLGILAIHKGDYDAAMRYFGSSTSCNAALAKILAGKYDAALSTLNANTYEIALKYYLRAIVGARTADNDMVTDNLKKAVELDASYADLAKKDLEFAKLLEDTTFKSVLQ